MKQPVKLTVNLIIILGVLNLLSKMKKAYKYNFLIDKRYETSLLFSLQFHILNIEVLFYVLQHIIFKLIAITITARILNEILTVSEDYDAPEIFYISTYLFLLYFELSWDF